MFIPKRVVSKFAVNRRTRKSVAVSFERFFCPGHLHGVQSGIVDSKCHVAAPTTETSCLSAAPMNAATFQHDMNFGHPEGFTAPTVVPADLVALGPVLPRKLSHQKVVFFSFCVKLLFTCAPVLVLIVFSTQAPELNWV